MAVQSPEQITGAFAVQLDARFDDLTSVADQIIFDFHNTGELNNVWFRQVGVSNDVVLMVCINDGNDAATAQEGVNQTSYEIIARDAIVEGRLDNWQVGVTPEGVMWIARNGVVLVAERKGVEAAPQAVSRAHFEVAETIQGVVPNLELANFNETADYARLTPAAIIEEQQITGAFAVELEARFDGLTPSDQIIFDFHNNGEQNNIWLVQKDDSIDVEFMVRINSGPVGVEGQEGVDQTSYTVTAPNAIVVGETATWSAGVTDEGVMWIAKNGVVLVAEDKGLDAIPQAVTREHFETAEGMNGVVPLLIVANDEDGDYASLTQPTISIAAPADVQEGDVGVGALEYTVTLSKAAAVTVTADIVVDGAVTGPTTVSFAPGETSKTLTFSFVADTTDEADEDVTVTLSNISGAVPVVASLAATATILDDDETVPPPPPSGDLPKLIIGTPLRQDEGDEGAGSFIFKVSMDKPSTVDVVADVKLYGDVSGPTQVTIPAGSVTGEIVVSYVHDTAPEVDEMIGVELSNLQNADAGASLFAVTSLLNNDGPLPNPQDLPVLVLAGLFSPKEGDSGETPMDFYISLSKPSDVDVTADVTILGEASGPTSITIPAGVTSFAIPITLEADTIDESNGLVYVRLSNVQNAVTDRQPWDALRVIDEDDPARDGLSAFEVEAEEHMVTNFRVETAEVDGTNNAFASLAMNPSFGVLEYNYKGATAVYDIALNTFDENDGVAQIDIIVNGVVVKNQLLDQDLGSAGFGASNKVAVTADSVTLRDGDVVQVRVTTDGSDIGRLDKMVFTPTGEDPLSRLTIEAPANVLEGAEGDAGQMVFTVNLDTPAATDVTADVAISGDATGPSTVLIKAGETSATITLDFQGDNADEPDETISVTLSNVLGANGAVLSASAQILDDDTPPPPAEGPFDVEAEDIILSGFGTETNAIEGSNGVVASLASSGPGSSGVLAYTYNGQSKAYDLSVHTFDETDGEAPIEIYVNGVLVKRQILDGALGDAGYSAVNKTTVDAPGLVLNFGDVIEVRTTFTDGEVGRIDKLSFTPVELPAMSIAGPAEVEEAAETIAFTVSLDKAAPIPATAIVTFSDGSTQTVNFAVGETSKTIDYDFNDDQIVEPDETVTATLSALFGADAGALTASTTVLDDDTAPVLSVTAPADAQEGAEGESGELVFTVSLNKPATELVTANVLVNGQSYQPIAIAAGQTTTEIRVLFAGDNANEPDEIVSVELVNLRGADAGALTASATILDDDAAQPPADGDRFEDNDDFAGAALLGAAALGLYENLSVEQGDEDYFRITATETGEMTVSTFFVHALGDVDLRIFDANQQRLGLSESVSDSETLTFNVVAGQDYFINVYGYDGAENDYVLSIEQPATTEPGDGDRFEVNESFDSATDLGGASGFFRDLSIDSATDQDYFLITATATGDMRVDAFFSDAGGDIDIEAFDASRNSIALSESATNDESMTFRVVEGQSYFVNVYGYDGAVNDYTLSVTQPDASVPTLPMLSVVAPEDVQEGGAGEAVSLVFTVALDAPSDADVTADVLIGGAAVGPATVRIAAGETTANIVVSFVGDDVLEADEIISVTLDNIVGAAVSEDEAEALVFDDDSTPGSQVGDDGSNRIDGDADADIIFGLGGNDVLRGNGGDDDLFGGLGNDRLIGNGGNDALFDGGGNDRLSGGNDDDALTSTGGVDTLIGGRGDDAFIIIGEETGTITITDFNTRAGDTDVLDLSGVNGIDSVEDLFDNHLTQSGDRATIVYEAADGGQSTIEITTVGVLEADDFAV